MHAPTVYLVEPITDRCRDWVVENVHIEGWMWMGKMFAVEHGYIDSLIAGMLDEGFVEEEDFQVVW